MNKSFKQVFGTFTLTKLCNCYQLFNTREEGFLLFCKSLPSLYPLFYSLYFIFQNEVATDP